jgi:hypothetical protein
MTTMLPWTADWWKPVETAPKTPDTQVLLWFPFSEPGTGCHMIGVWSIPSEHPEDGIADPCWVDPSEGEPLGDPSHWMPLPPRPRA